MLLRTLGFFSLAIATTYPRLLLAIVVSALGGAVFDAPQSAAIAALTDEAERRRFFSLTGVLAGLGIVLGTQAGALLIAHDFVFVSILAGICFLVVFLLTFLLLPPVAIATERQPFTRGLSLALHDRAFVSFNALLMGYWFLWSQFYISVPLMSAHLAGQSSVAWVYAVNSLVTVALGYTLPRALEKRLPSYQMLIAGVAIAAVGIGSVALTGSFGPFLVSVFVLSVGTVLVRPGERTVTAALADPAARGSYFGVGSLSVAIGGGLGNWAGGLLYDAGQRSDMPAMPWIVFGVVGLGAAAGLWLLGQRNVVRFERERPAAL
jgi:DHA1 family multidrug resistance protein-like MFS transporter